MKIKRTFGILAVCLFVVLSISNPATSQILHEKKGYNFNVVQLDPCVQIDVLDQDRDHYTITLELTPVLDPNITCGSNYKTPMFFINNTPLQLDLLDERGIVIPNNVQYAPLQYYGIDREETGFIWFSGGSLNQLPKTFNLYLGVNKDSDLGTLYAGTGTYGIEVTDATYPYVNTTCLSYMWGNPAQLGKAITQLHCTGNAGNTQMTTERIFRQQGDAFKNTGYYDVIEAGSTRAVLRFYDQSEDSEQYYYIMNFKRGFYTEVIDHSNNFGWRGDKMNVLGKQSANIGAYYGDKGIAGGTQIFPLDEAIHTATLGWINVYLTDNDFGYLWNINDTSGSFYIGNDGVQMAFHMGYDVQYPANTWVKTLVLMGDGNQSLSNTDWDTLYSNSYWADNITTINHTGSIESKHYNAMFLRYANVSPHQIETNITIIRPNDPVSEYIDGYYSFQTQNMSDIDDFYFYFNGSLVHHYAYNNTDWTYGANDPTYAGNSEIQYGGNESQFCAFNSTGNVYNRCNNSMTAITDGFYFVTTLTANRSIVVYYNDSQIVASSPTTTTTTPTTAGNCSCVKNINVDIPPASTCIDNNTIFHNYTFRSSEGLDYVYSYESCPNGCDWETNTCNPSAFEVNTWFIVIAIGLIIGAVWLNRWLNRL